MTQAEKCVICSVIMEDFAAMVLQPNAVVRDHTGDESSFATGWLPTIGPHTHCHMCGHAGGRPGENACCTCLTQTG